MKKPIQDEFTRLPISRQRRYQLRQARNGRCPLCGARVVQGSRCVKHLVEARERQRELQQLKRRYYGTMSYQLQAKSGGLSLPILPSELRQERPVYSQAAQQTG